MNELKKEIDKVIPKKGMFKQAGYFLNKLFISIIDKLVILKSNLTTLTGDINAINESCNELYNELYNEIDVINSKINILPMINKVLPNIIFETKNALSISFEDDNDTAVERYFFSNIDNISDASVFLNGKLTTINNKYTLEPTSDNKYRIMVISDNLDNARALFSNYNIGNGNSYYPSNGFDIILPHGMTIIPENFCVSRGIKHIYIPNSIKELHYMCLANTYINALKLSTKIEYIRQNALSQSPINKLVIPKLEAPNVDISAFGSTTTRGTLGNFSQYTGYGNRGNNKLIVPTGATGYEGGAWDILLDPEKCGFTIEYSDELLEEINNN